MVKCNKCNWEGVEEDLKPFDDADGGGYGCPNCKTDHCLMDKEEKRYWIDTMPLIKPYGPGTLGIVDEEAGGVFAYVGSEENAKRIIAALEMTEP